MAARNGAREGVRDRAVELPELGAELHVVGVVAVVDDGFDVGDPRLVRLVDGDEDAACDRELVEREMRLSSTADVPAARRLSSFRSRSVVKIGVSSTRPSTTPACLAAIVQPPRTTCAERPASARSVSADR